MPDLQPFRGVRYNPLKVPDLSKVTAPPYDVIDEAARARLADRDEHNIVRLILPQDGKDTDRYTCAAELLRRWLAEGVLLEDARPGIYVIRQEWQSGSRQHERTGFIAAVGLEPFGEGKIYPHENTLSAPKEDRLRLLEATRANLSQVFSIFPDEDATVDAWLTRATSPPAGARSVDDAGVVTSLWCEFDGTRIAGLQTLMADRKLFIADGHHRYETALNYQRRRAEAGTASPHGAENALMMLCVAMSNPGLVTYPTHRLLPAEGVSPDELIEKLKAQFRVQSIATFSRETGELDAILSSDTTPNLMVLYVGKSLPPMLVWPKDPAKLRERMPVRSDVWRSLDVSILQYAVLEGMLGLTLEHVTSGAKIGYVHDADEALRRVDEGGFSAAFILRPTPVSAVAEVASHLEKMPPKSTFFYPKAVTGMVLRRLNDG